VSYNPIIDNFLPSPSVFGNGSDGDVVISSNTTLARDMHYNNLTINATFTLNPSSWRIFVKGLLTINGTIAHNGNSSALNSSTGAAGAGTVSAFLLVSGGGGNGSAGAGATAGAVIRSTGGMGGTGGSNGANAGGLGGTLTTIAAVEGGANYFRSLPVGPLWGKAIGALGSGGYAGGSGGGGAGGGAGGAGTGGGSGGGSIFIGATKIVSNTGGTISAIGGNSGAVSVTNRSTGGGGGGGFIYIATATPIAGNIVITVAGGVGGAIIGGTGVVGAAGLIGKTVTEICRSLNS
jgi:hypothetical protein